MFKIFIQSGVLAIGDWLLALAAKVHSDPSQQMLRNKDKPYSLMSICLHINNSDKDWSKRPHFVCAATTRHHYTRMMLTQFKVPDIYEAKKTLLNLIYESRKLLWKGVNKFHTLFSSRLDVTHFYSRERVAKSKRLLAADPWEPISMTNCLPHPSIVNISRPQSLPTI